MSKPKPVVLALAFATAILFGCDLRSAEVGDVADAPTEPRVSSRVDAAGPGRWKEFRTHRFDDSLDAAQRQMIAELEAIGYAQGSTEGAGGLGVVMHDTSRSWPGTNLYTSGHAPEARLIDMEGEPLHVWRKPFFEVWPDYPVEANDPATAYWRRAHVLPGGELLAIFEGLGLLKLDRDSKLVWAQPNRAHHDLDVLPSGEIYVLTREAHVVARVHPREPILEDLVVVLGPDGEERRRVSVLEALERSPFAHLAGESSKPSGDIFHTNSIEVLRADHPAAGPAFRAGNVLVSMRELNVIAVIDLDEEVVLWAGQGAFRRQHDPRMLQGDKILLFDNSGLGERSRALEIDAASDAEVWAYSGSASDYLYSKWCGTVQPLANGNVLVTESDNGRAVEVTRTGETVWEFHSPHRAGEGGRFVATLFELERLPTDLALGFARAGGGNADER